MVFPVHFYKDSEGDSSVLSNYEGFCSSQREEEQVGQVYDNVKGRVEVTPVGEIPLKGKEQGVFIYQVDNVKEQ